MGARAAVLTLLLGACSGSITSSAAPDATATTDSPLSGTSDAVSGTSDALSGNPDALFGSPDAVSGTSDALSGTSDAVSGPPDAMSGSPDAMSGPPDAMSGPPDAVSGPPDAMSGPPDAVSGPPDAMSGPPDAMSGSPEAMSGPPDAMSGSPDAMSGPPDAPLPPDAMPGSPDAPLPPDAMSGPPDATLSPDARVVPDAMPSPDASVGPCPTAPPGMPATTLAAWNRVNETRVAMGIGCATLVPALVTSADKHCQYYVANKDSQMCVKNLGAHVEVAGCPLFYEAQFWQRETKAGYTGSPAFEDMYFGLSAAAAAQGWIDSVWHRTPILSPWVADLGHAEAPGCATMDFGVGNAAPNATIATYPYDGQTGVPTSFNGHNEGPEPPVPPAGWPSGYPITIYIRAILTEHVLTVDGDPTPIPHQWLTPATQGLLSHESVLYSNAPLAPLTTYRVHVSGDGHTIEFTFTTK